MVDQEGHNDAGAAALRQAEPQGPTTGGSASALAAMVVFLVGILAETCLAKTEQDSSNQIAVQPGMDVLLTSYQDYPSNTVIPWSMVTVTKILVRLLYVVLVLAAVARRTLEYGCVIHVIPLQLKAPLRSKRYVHKVLPTVMRTIFTNTNAARAREAKLISLAASIANNKRDRPTEREQLDEAARIANQPAAAAVAVMDEEEAALGRQRREADKYRKVPDANLCHTAAKNGNIAMLKWAKGREYPWDKRTCCFAARNGHLEVLKWARENGCPWDKSTCCGAAENGHLGVLQWARGNGCPWDWTTCCGAAAAGYLEVLQWARENGCPWDKCACSWAAGNGHLEVLQWARENECPWDGSTCSEAAENGRLEVLQWARANGCPWDEGACYGAAENGHLEVLHWARENGCPWDEDTCLLAARNGHLEVLQWARENGCPWNKKGCLAEAASVSVADWISIH